jgi:ABC-2 type transport system ATP-binding protein
VAAGLGGKAGLGGAAGRQGAGPGVSFRGTRAGAGAAESGPVIEIAHLSKRYRRRAVVDDVSFRAVAGRVTALVGPNGAGKSSVLRVLLGLDRADAGTAAIGGRRYRELESPMRTVGAMVDGAGALPERRAADHLGWIARSQGIGRRRVREMLEMAGLDGRKRVGTFSLGMRQRLSLATALLGEPEVLILDEPANGLDPAWLRRLREIVAGHAKNGGTVLVASHLMAQTAETADDVVVLRAGRKIAEGPIATITAGHGSLEDAFLALTGAIS